MNGLIGFITWSFEMELVEGGSYLSAFKRSIKAIKQYYAD